MIPSYLNDLQLDVVFKTYTKNVEAYIQRANNDEYIIDSELFKVSVFVSSSSGQDEFLQGKAFAVKNPNHKEFSLLQIDNAIISTCSTKRCDCAISNEDFLSFIEFKANAISTKEKTIKQNYKKAMKQLKTTKQIMEDELKKLGKDILAIREVNAYVCFRKGYPRFTNSESQYRVNFANDTKISLSFEPMKVI